MPDSATAQLVACAREDVASSFGKFMSLRRAVVLLPLFLCAIAGHPPNAAAGELNVGMRRVALVEAPTLPDRMEDTRTQLHGALIDAVHHRGFEVVATGSNCVDASCLPDVASSAGATDVLVIRGGKSGSHGYHMDLTLWSATTRTASPAVVDCTVCTGPQMVDAVGRAANSLLDQAPVAEARPLFPVAPAPEPINAPPTLSNPTPKTAGTVDDHRGRRIVGWSLVGVGVAAAVGGGVIWSMDGKGTDCMNSSCRSMYHTRNEGVC